MMLYIYIAVIVLSIVLDQITKYAVVANMAEGQSIPIIENILHFTYVTNDGAAMGMMDDYRWVFMSVSTIALVGIGIWLVVRYKHISKLTGIAFAMIAGGGIGNMIDRIFNGETFGNGVVVDFIDFCAFPEIWMWIFNVADVFVCVGVGLAIFDIIVDEVRKYRQEKADKKLIAENKNGDTEGKTDDTYTDR
ncbi:MAG: signal peptidase II [Ruminococcaceae bacterium]|nr:signal peptidase II [Oscillospiraceae bacterium]